MALALRLAFAAVSVARAAFLPQKTHNATIRLSNGSKYGVGSLVAQPANASAQPIDALHRNVKAFGRSADPNWDGKTVQEESKYSVDYPKDENNVASATQSSGTGAQANASQAATASQTPPTGSDEWYAAEKEKINEQCKENHERLEQLRAQQAQEKVAEAAAALEKEKEVLQQKQEELKKMQADVVTQESAVAAERQEVLTASTHGKEQKEELAKKQQELEKMQSIVAQKKQCVEELKQAQEQLAAEQGKLEAIKEQAAGAQQAVETAKQDLPEVEARLRAAEEAQAAAQESVEAGQAKVAAAEAKLAARQKEVAAVHSGASRKLISVALVPLLIAVLISQ